jgi:hypothetical protein
MDAVALALGRTYLSITLAKSGAPVPVARCAADRLIRQFTVAQLNDPKIDQAQVAQAVAPCRNRV